MLKRRCHNLKLIGDAADWSFAHFPCPPGAGEAAARQAAAASPNATRPSGYFQKRISAALK
jgi:hypothetical protein